MLAALVVRDNVRYRKRIEYFYRYAINQAQREILIANAYFVPDAAARGALQRRIAERRSDRARLSANGW